MKPIRNYKFTILYRGTLNVRSTFLLSLNRIDFYYKLEELQQLYGRPHVKWIEA